MSERNITISDTQSSIPLFLISPKDCTGTQKKVIKTNIINSDITYLCIVSENQVSLELTNDQKSLLSIRFSKNTTLTLTIPFNSSFLDITYQ
jgi:hypothetical protein